MNIFDRIRIRNFRRLQDVDLKLRPLNVMIGANGSGKTSLLDVFSLLASSASGNLNDCLSDMAGIKANLTALQSERDVTRGELRFHLEKLVPERPPLKYDLALRASGISHQIGEETLTLHADPSLPRPLKYIDSPLGRVRYLDPNQGRLMAPTWEHDPLETALSQVPKMYFEPEDFRKSLASSTHYHVLDVSRRAPVRLPQPMREARLPGKDGEDLVSCLYWMREADPNRFEVIEDTLRVGFPNFERLNFPPVAAGTLALTWKERGMQHPFFMHQLSEGTLRFLWLVTLLYSPGLTEVTMIDEPEVSLHPELLSTLADCLREASQRTQLIIATHADRLVRFLEPDEVVVVDLHEEGISSATRADELDLAQWLSEYTLDQVWQHGRMGGRP